MTDETKERIIKNAKEKLADALKEGLASGLTYGDVCAVIANTLNSYKKEVVK